MDLKEALHSLPAWLSQGVDNSFMTPVAFTLLAAHSVNKKKTAVPFTNVSVNSYADTIGFHNLLCPTSTLREYRPNLGATYSQLTLLKNKERVNSATQEISDCIHNQLGRLQQQPSKRFVADLIKVIGELHDNVWSHGHGVGTSLAQIYNANSDQGFIEFAVVDCGMGFLRELKSKNIPVVDSEQAINWCLEKGNTSKGPKDEDDGWGQWLPEDSMGSPMNIPTSHQDQSNHHQGLGLHLLEKLAKNAKGTLQIATGDALVTVQNGHKTCCEISNYSGVAIICRFTLIDILSYSEHSDDLPVGTDQIISRIKNSSS